MRCARVLTVLTVAAALDLQEIPTGHPDCLTNKTMVVTGNLESLTRDEAEDLFKRHGGKTTSSVSGKTTFLLVGQNCGRSKTKGVRCSTRFARCPALGCAYHLHCCTRQCDRGHRA